jgi:hypothetical protein
LKTLNEIVIQAPLKAVYQAAERIVDWPKFLPHYRWVTLFEEQGLERHVEMAASRDGFPCLWQSLQVLHPKKNKIYFRHTRSTWSQGMEVWWILEPLKGGSTKVSITHDMPPSANVLMNWFRQYIVGDFFVHNIASKTLAGMKLHLEQA